MVQTSPAAAEDFPARGAERHFIYIVVGLPEECSQNRIWRAEAQRPGKPSPSGLFESSTHVLNTPGLSFFFKKNYLFIHGCVGSSLLRAGFL